MLSKLRPFQLSRKEEQNYRQTCLKTDIVQSRISLLLFISSVILVAISDLRSLGHFGIHGIFDYENDHYCVLHRRLNVFGARKEP
jgi:hypothetical protein